MKNLSLLTFVVNCIAWLISLFRICSSRGEVFDYIVVFFTFSILVYDIRKIVTTYIKRKEDRDRTVDGSRGQEDGSVS